MTTDKDPSRVAFEAQCEYLGESTRRIFTSPDQYSSSTTALAWAMWQASREQALDEAAALFPQPHVEYFGSDIQDAIRRMK